MLFLDDDIRRLNANKRSRRPHYSVGTRSWVSRSPNLLTPRSSDMPGDWPKAVEAIDLRRINAGEP